MQYMTIRFTSWCLILFDRNVSGISPEDQKRLPFDVDHILEVCSHCSLSQETKFSLFTIKSLTVKINAMNTVVHYCLILALNSTISCCGTFVPVKLISYRLFIYKYLSR